MKLSIAAAFGAALGVAAVCLSAPQPVQACGMIFKRTGPAPALIALNEKLLDLGDNHGVVAQLEREVPVRLLSAASVETLDARGLRLVATAVVRSEGEAFPSFRQHLDTRQRLLWAIGMLESLETDDDPRMSTARAVGLSQLRDRRGDARKILEDLAQRDLITSPRGYQALAQLRHEAGDELGGNDALARCALMSVRDDSECGPDAADIAGQRLAMASR